MKPDKEMISDEWKLVVHIGPEDLKNQVIKTVSVEGKHICLLREKETLFAFAATCPHAGAALDDGWINSKGEIVCCLHKYRFDPSNGRNTSGEGYRLRTFPVRIRNGRIFVNLNPLKK